VSSRSGSGKVKVVPVPQDPLSTREPQHHERVCMWCEKPAADWVTFWRCTHVLCARCAALPRHADCRYGTRWEIPPAREDGIATVEKSR